MRTWTRTLNLDDAHTLLALAAPGCPLKEWTARCHEALPELSVARRRELVRILRDDVLRWQEGAHPGFLHHYEQAPATDQVEILQLAWALAHPLSLLAAGELVRPRLRDGAQRDLPLAAIEALVARHVTSDSPASLRKTRTTLLGALEGVGCVVTRGTGQHRQVRASRGRATPRLLAYAVWREGRSVLPSRSLAARLTQCGADQARIAAADAVEAGLLRWQGERVASA